MSNSLPLDLGQLIAALTALQDPTPVPLTDWAAAVLEVYASRPGPSTRYKMRQVLGELLALAAPDATTAALGPDLVARIAARPGAASTTAGLLASLRAACRLGAERGWLTHATVRACRWTVPADPPKARWHSRADVARVLGWLGDRSDTWPGGRLYAFGCLCAYAGLRRSEALHLRVADCDLVAGILSVRPHERPLKTLGSCAAVPLPGALAAVLTAWLPRCGCPWVVPCLRRSGPWTGGCCGKRAGDQLRMAGEACGVSGFTPHSLRHSLATHLAGHWGLSRGQIRLVLRHSSEAMQTVYVHRDLADLTAAVAGFRYDDPPPVTEPERPRPRLRLVLS